MKQKTVEHPIRNTREYVQLFNGIFELTSTEMDILSEFIQLQLQMDRAGWQANAFSTDGRKVVSERIEKKNPDMNKKDHRWLGPYIKLLKDKGVITPITGGYTIDSRLIPRGESEIIFRIRP